MEITYYDSLEDFPSFQNDLMKLLITCDEEFIPALSSRIGTLQKGFRFEIYIGNDRIPQEYFNALLKQKFILILNNNRIIGFMSFVHGFYDNEFFSPVFSADGINNYVSTICVDPDFRNKGLANNLYSYIEGNLPDNVKSSYISTRTWSTNTGHINLLIKRNFTLTHTLYRDRIENGKEIDSVYYCKKID